MDLHKTAQKKQTPFGGGGPVPRTGACRTIDAQNPQLSSNREADKSGRDVDEQEDHP